MATINEATPSYINRDPRGLAWYNEESGLNWHDLENLEVMEDSDLLIPPETLPPALMHDAVLLWPQEWMLVRALHLPLKSASLLDGDMLLQELADQSGIDPDEWWLCWTFHPDDDGGIHGLVFGIPEALRQAITNDDGWQHCRHIGIDGWHRVAPHIEAGGDVALLDQDEEGIFIAFHRAACWRGLRRLNGSCHSDWWDELTASLQAMGFDPEEHPVRGNISDVLQQHLNEHGWNWQGTSTDALLPRHHANLRSISQHAMARSTPNFRHGRWAKSGNWQMLRPWLRSAALAASLLLVLFIGQFAEIAHLKSQQRDAEARIEAAFHSGLPDAPVMLDPLAQLQQAAAELNGSSAPASRLLNDMEAVSRVYKQTPWDMKSFDLQQGKVQIAGEIGDVQGLNTLQSALEQSLALPVRIADTNLGQKVSFRLEWLWP